MKVAVFGTGMVGRAIAGKLAQLGHDVVVGTRDVNALLERRAADAMGRPMAPNRPLHCGLLLVTAFLVSGCAKQEPAQPREKVRKPVPVFDIESTDWRVDKVHPGGRMLTLVYGTGDPECYKLHRINRRESRHRVSISVYLRVVKRYKNNPPGKKYLCNRRRYEDSTTVNLDDPLGDRELVDSATGQVIGERR